MSGVMGLLLDEALWRRAAYFVPKERKVSSFDSDTKVKKNASL